jgi:hypothetical protein
MTYAFARQHVTWCKEGLPDRTVWLVIKRTLGVEPTYAYYISNAPASTPLRTFVWLSDVRWAVEQCFEEGKAELGEWRTMKCANTRPGTTICSQPCWRISFCGT